MLGVDGPVQWTAISGVVGLMSINLTFAGLLLRSYRERQKDDNVELDEVRKDLEAVRQNLQNAQLGHFRCEQKQNILIWTLQNAGIAVPEMIWSFDDQQPK